MKAELDSKEKIDHDVLKTPESKNKKSAKKLKKPKPLKMDCFED